MNNGKYKLLLVGFLIALSFALAACDGGPGAPTATQSGDTIDLQAFGDPAEMKIIEELVAAFKVKRPEAQINVINVPSQADHMAKLQTSFAGGDPPDVWLLNYRRYGQFAAQGVIEPAGPLVAQSSVIKEDMYYEQALAAFRLDGVLQCVPQNISSLVVYWNKNLFTEYGVPFPQEDWTWQDFLDAARAMSKDTDGDGTNDIHGLGVEPQLIRVAPFVWQNGGEIVDDPERPTRLTLRDGAAREAVQFFFDLQLVHKVVPNEPQTKAEDLESRFMNGKLGMLMSSRVSTPAFRAITGFEWDVADLPMGKQKASILHSDAFCISKNIPDRNKELAWAFVEFSQSPEGQPVAARLGRTVPSLRQVAESPVFLEPTEPPPSSRVFLDAIEVMRQTPVLSTWPKIESMVNAELERAFFNAVPVEEALQRAEEEAAKLFADAYK